MVSEFMENFVIKLIAYRIAKKDHIIGCTQDEIRKLEIHYKITLPKSYKDFLLTLGKRSGGFCGDLLISYQFLFDLKVYALKILRYDNSDLKLPDDTFVFNVYNDEGFSYFQTDINNDDPPVYVYQNGDIVRDFKYFSEWLLASLESSKPYS
jgi:hypothetical protein